MRAAVVVPGIMGTALHLPRADGTKGDAIWPPTASEVALGYPHITDLQRDDLVVGEIIHRVSCFHFYDLLIALVKGLGYSVASPTRRLVPFPYDWRLDNFDTADLLANRLDGLEAEGVTEIYLLAHSMGGLVSRLLLETGRFDHKPWFAKIKLLSTFGTPHLGAPLALARIFGLDTSAGISGAQFAALAANRKYPSGYQLIPAPGEAAIWDLNSTDVAPLDPYDPTVATALGMDPVLVDRAAALHRVLGPVNRPDHVRYFYYGGTGHTTVTRVNAYHMPGQVTDHTTSILTRTPASGDGTVPIYSALPHIGQRQLIKNKHATVFKGVPFQKVFYRTLGGDAGLPVEMINGTTRTPGRGLELSLNAEVYTLGTFPELILTVTDTETPDGFGFTDTLTGNLVVTTREADGAAGSEVARIPIVYTGPPISGLTVLLVNSFEPGLYAVSFEGDLPAEAYEAFAMRARP